MRGPNDSKTLKNILENRNIYIYKFESFKNQRVVFCLARSKDRIEFYSRIGWKAMGEVLFMVTTKSARLIQSMLAYEL